MKVEFLFSGSPDCPLIRVFGQDQDEARDFRNATLELAAGVKPSVTTEEIFGKQSSINCCLIMRLGDVDFAPVEQENGGAFEWVLTHQRWQKVSDLLAPFTLESSAGAFQWLSDANDEEISILFSCSKDGHW